MGLEHMPPQPGPPGTTPGRFSASIWSQTGRARSPSIYRSVSHVTPAAWDPRGVDGHAMGCPCWRTPRGKRPQPWHGWADDWKQMDSRRRGGGGVLLVHVAWRRNASLRTSNLHSEHSDFVPLEILC